jgi:hypothetical protein
VTDIRLSSVSDALPSLRIDMNVCAVDGMSNQSRCQSILI